MQAVVDSIEVYIPTDLQFHIAICAVAHNELLQKIMVTLDTLLLASCVITAQIPGANREAMPLHWAITEAIRSRDAQAAEAAMQKLVMLTTDDIQRALNVDRVGKKGG